MPSAVASPAWRIPELVLLFAEQVDDPTTLLALMRVNRQIFSIIRLHERSISKSFIRSLEFVSISGRVFRQQDLKDDDLLPLLSFAAVSKLQRRHRRICDLVRGPLLAATEPMPVEQRTSLLTGLRRALHICDSVADLGVLGVCGATPDADKTLADALALRTAQVNLLQALLLVDLAYLKALTNLASKIMNHSAHLGDALDDDNDGSGDDGDTTFIYTLLSFEELVLYRGSLFLWDYTLGCDQQKEHARGLNTRAALEAEEWEQRVDKLPALHHALARCFTEKAKCEFGDMERRVWEITLFQSREGRLP